MTDNLNKLADHYGIFPSFKDLDRNIQATSRETQLALLAGNGIVVDNDAMIAEHLAEIKAQNAIKRLPDEIIITSNQTNQIFNLQSAEWRVELENGDTFACKTNGRITLPATAKFSKFPMP